MAIIQTKREYCACRNDYIYEYLCDTENDVSDLPACCTGSTALVCSTGNVYIVNASGEWVLFGKEEGGSMAQQQPLYEHSIKYSNNGAYVYFMIYNNSPTQITQFSMLFDRIQEVSSYNKYYRVPATGVFDGYPVIDLAISEDWVCVDVVENGDTSEYDLNESATLTDQVTQIF